MKATFFPSVAKGRAIAPPSKSVAHRLLIACALADGQSRISGISASEDMLATLSCVRALGSIATVDGDTVHIKPCAKKSLENAVFECRESGSTLRFFLPIALAMGAKDCVFRGSERLIQRGFDVYNPIFEENGIVVEKRKDCLIVSGKLRGGRYEIRGDVSSQYVTGLLFALSITDGDSELKILEPIESRAYIDLTLDVMKRCGVSVEERRDNEFAIKCGRTFSAGEYGVEGDWSNAAFLFAFNMLGGNVEVSGLTADSPQGDKVCIELFDKLNEKNAVVDVSDCPDLAPILFAVSAMKHGATFVGTRRLKIKESDRAEAMASELAKYGVKVQVGENQTIVYGTTTHAPSRTICSHNDHRIAMANAVILSKVGGTLDGIECTKKSYPDFFETIAKLGVKYEIE